MIEPFSAFNDRAIDVITDPVNSRFASTIPKYGRVLDVGFNNCSKSRSELATLGRSDCEITVTGRNISRLQCSFQIDLDSGVVMLCDRSNNQTTQPFGDTAVPFKEGCPRRIVVRPGTNNFIEIGRDCDHCQFKLIWHKEDAATIEELKSLDSILWTQDEDPRFAQTVRAESTFRMPARMYTPGEQNPMLRYRKIGDPIGIGSYGVVFKCVNLDSGQLLALKELMCPPGESLNDWHNGLNPEVKALSRISHKHIVNFITAQPRDETVEIFMGLKEGSLRSKVQSKDGLSLSGVDRLLWQMLHALDYLTRENIVHRDIKPDNILYTSQPGGQLCFQLGDFGLCKDISRTMSCAGTALYMAPEQFSGRAVMTCKLDVWSLFVTLMWTVDADHFRQSPYEFADRKVREDRISKVATKVNPFPMIRSMAYVNINKRASAAEMLASLISRASTSPQRDASESADVPIAVFASK
ncbi:MAG: hypothetical protein M1825_001768 [Sarcosagium campestre]|nr:MAG: hypothetical protein M1825_001768 [Sarcosagium campestre]